MSKKKSDIQRKELFRELCQKQNLPTPQAEYQFAKDIGRKWRIDYFFETSERKVALEVEGGVWTKGRHTRGKGFVGDMEKYNEMAVRGILLLRVVPDDLLKPKTFELLKKTLYSF